MKTLACLFIAASLMVPVAFAADSNQSCLIVRKKDGHTMLNLFLFGPPGLIVTATAKYSTVDSFNLPSVKTTYWGSDLQKLSEQKVHVIIVSHNPDSREVEAARGSCHGEPPKPDPDDSDNWWKPTNPQAGAKMPAK